jgi:DNA repair exonuclease SbcCD ATPase subunit
MKRLCKELSNNQSQEIHCLKSQHDKTTAEFKADVSDHAKIAVENAVMLAWAETNQKIRQLMNHHNENLKATQNEANERMNAKISILQSELFEATVIAQEVPGLQTRINEHRDNETTLQSDVRRLQDSLDSCSSSNQHTIDELKRENEQLRCEMRDVNQALNDSVKQVRKLWTLGL